MNLEVITETLFSLYKAKKLSVYPITITKIVEHSCWRHRCMTLGDLDMNDTIIKKICKMIVFHPPPGTG